MKVNAQVTVVITTLETLGNLLNFVIWSIWAKITGGNPSFLMVIQGLLLNFVLLPYTFLMNTRYNKNRIIEGGWKVVLKNLKYSTKEVVKTLPEKIDIPPKIKKLDVVPFIKDYFGPKTYSRIQPICIKNNVEPSVYVIKYSNTAEKEVCTISIEKDSMSITSDILQEQETNYTIASPQSPLFEANEQPRCSFDLKDEMRNLDDTPPLTKKQLKDFRIVRGRLLSDLLKNIDVEGIYVRNLMRLIRIEESKKNNEEIDNVDFKEDDDIFQGMPHFVGNQKLKISMRREIVHLLRSNKDDDELYNELFEEFMEMEENFVSNGC